jgi:hypothetical protein
VKLINSFNQVFEASAEAVEFPNDERITGAAKFNGVNQTLPIIFCTVCLIGKDFFTTGF